MHAASAADAVIVPLTYDFHASKPNNNKTSYKHTFIMTTRTEKFQRKPRDADSEPTEAEEILRFPPEEEAVCVLNPCRDAQPPFIHSVLMIWMAVSPRRIKHFESCCKRSVCSEILQRGN